MTKSKLGSAFGGALAAALLITAAQAQPAAPAPGQGPRPERMQRLAPEAMAARRAERLRTVLQLRPDQQGALDAYLAALKPQAGLNRTRSTPRQTLTTPERLDRQQAAMRERMARFEQRAAATKRFYAVLSPAQQKAFDALKPGHGKRSEHRGGRHGGGRGPMMRG